MYIVNNEPESNIVYEALNRENNCNAINNMWEMRLAVK